MQAQPKNGGLRCGHSPKKRGQREKGDLRHVHNPKRWEFRTGFEKKEGLKEPKLLEKGSWELIYLLSSLLLVNMINWTVCSGRLKKRGLRCMSNSKGGGGGLRCGSGQKGGSLPRHIPILNIYVSSPPPPLPRSIGQVFFLCTVTRNCHAHDNIFPIHICTCVFPGVY